MVTYHSLCLLLAIVLTTIVSAEDYLYTCPRPEKVSEKRSARWLRHQAELAKGIPCDLGRESWCGLPGEKYPWGSVRRFVQENQGLMRRMYGEVRQLSLMRMEMIESNSIEDLDYRPEEEQLFSDKDTRTRTRLEVVPEATNENNGGGRSMETLDDLSNDDRVTLSTLTEEEEEETPTTTDFFTTTTAFEEPSSTTTTTHSLPASSPPTPTLRVDVGGAPPTPTLRVDVGGEISPTPTTTANSTTTPMPQQQTAARNNVLIENVVKPQLRAVNACPVKEEVVAPYWANNTRGEILALLNLYPFEQYVHWEKCNFENRQMFCRQGCRCEQQYRLHRLLAFDPTNECRGVFSDWFRFPSCCVCRCYLTEEQISQLENTSDLSSSSSPPTINRSPRKVDQSVVTNDYYDPSLDDVSIDYSDGSVHGYKKSSHHFYYNKSPR